LGEYLPEAPVDDEARERNGKLSGMGGVFNTVNLHLYHYAGNNPVKYTDPDGRADKKYTVSFMLFGFRFTSFGTKKTEPVPAEMNKFMDFIKKQGVERTSAEPFKFEKIADNWDDLPESVREYTPQDEWAAVTYDKGNHDKNLRLPGGYHLSTEKDEEGNSVGVFVHFDDHDTFEGVDETLSHVFNEVVPHNAELPELNNANPDWNQ
jgi:hypothetical protein